MTSNSQPFLEMPLKPTWRRYREIFLRNSNISIYRALEYEAISRVPLAGRVLDYGGGDRAHYAASLKARIQDGHYESVNISTEMLPTYLIRPGERIPVADATFDMVVSINTLEHVYDLEPVLMEMLRVLKPGGRLILAVPFLFRVHACPDDYNRPTASWWHKTLLRLGADELQIRPLVWDAMTTGLSVTEGAGPFNRLRRVFTPLYGLLYAAIKARGSEELYPRAVGEQLANLALGYIITGTRA